MNRTFKKVASIGLSVSTAVYLFGAAAIPAGAQSTADLQAQIAALLAQIQQLQAQLAAQSGGGAPAPSYNFTRNLTIGSVGDDVRALQQWLNANGYTVAASGPGSSGNETRYFGPATRAALAKYQAAVGISPASGYFGPITRARIAQSGGAPGTGTTPPAVTVPAGTDLVVSLASDSPAARTIGSGTAFNPAAKFALTAGSKTVKITGITVSKSGFLANTNLNGVDIIDSKGMRHGNVVTGVNADNTVLITMSSDPIVVPAGSTEYITVRFNLLSGNYTGTVSFGINSVSAITADTSAISGAFPLMGAVMNIVNGGSSLASTTIDVLTSTGSSSLNVDPNSLQEITRFRIQENSSNEGVYLHKLTLYNYGNAGASDYKDVTLEAQDGTVLATAQPSGQYVTFNLASPYFIDKGLTRDFTVKAKLVDGTTKTINLVVYNNYDIDLRGSATGVSVIPGAGTNDSSFPIGNGFNVQTIGSGSITLTRASDSPSSAVVPGATNVVLAKFIAKPTGEDYELRQISFYVATSTTAGALDLTGTIFVKVNGATVYSVAASDSSNTAASTVTLTSYPILARGQNNVITVEGSIPSSATSASSYTVTNFDLIQAKRLVTNDLVDPGVGAVSGLTVPVNAAALSVTTLSTPSIGSVVVGTVGHEYATFQLNAAGSGEDVKVSKIVVDHVETANYAEVGNLLMYKDNETSPLSTTASTATNGDTVSFNFASPILVTRSTPVTLHLKADALSGTNAHTFRISSSTSAVTAVGASTGNTLTNGSDITFAGSGQAQTHVAAGSLTLSLVSGSGASPSADQTVAAGSTNQVLFAFKLTSQYEAQKITSLKIYATSSGSTGLATSTIQNIRIYEGNSTTPIYPTTAWNCGVVTAGTCSATWTASDNILSAPVPTTGVTIYVKGDIGAGGVADLGNSYKFYIASSTGDVAVKGAVSGSTSGTRTGTPAASGYTFVVPQNVVIEAVSPTSPTNVGTGAGQTVAVFKVTNNGSAPILLSTSTLTFTNGGSATTTTSFKIYASAVGGGQNDTSGWNSGNGYLAAAGTTGASSTVSFATTSITAAEQKIDGGSWRYLTIKTSAASANNDTYQFSVSALGNILFNAAESDLGYSGNASSDADRDDTIFGLRVNGLPSLATVTAKN